MSTGLVRSLLLSTVVYLSILPSETQEPQLQHVTAAQALPAPPFCTRELCHLLRIN